MKKNKILFLGAHPDDEFGCSGSLCRFLEEGKDVFFAVFSFCEESIPTGFPKDILRNELNSALEVVGIKNKNVIKYDFKVRHFPENRQKILEELICLKKDISPDVILLPALSDIHQDHHTLAMEGLRAFKHNTIFGYELPQNTLTFQHSCYVALQEKHVDRKIESLLCYKSQAHRPYTNNAFIKGMAKIRGVQIGEEFAEAFEAIRLII